MSVLVALVRKEIPYVDVAGYSDWLIKLRRKALLRKETDFRESGS